MQHASLASDPQAIVVHRASTGEPLYAINDLYASVQGEGTHTGIPMVIVRLQGCPVGCPFCDTKETWTLAQEQQHDPDETSWRGTNPRWTRLDAQTIAQLARKEAPWLKWILLTGGEPALHPLGALIDAFHGQGFRVAIETSGTAVGFIGTGVDFVTVSPKVGMPGGRSIQRAAVRAAHEVKWLVGRREDLDRLRVFMAEYAVDAGRVSLQPISANVKATAVCFEAALAYGFRVSIQVHKIMDVR
jgi:7-carboxy-7-deazaguanine synthase